jgi:putative lipoprotein
MRTPAIFVFLCMAFALIGSAAMRAQSGAGDAPSDLQGTWQLVRFQGGDDKTLVPSNKANYTLTFGTDGTVAARIDCNRGHGTWKSAGKNQLEFGPMALTRAMCPPAPLNDRLPKDLGFVRSYVLKEGHLFLSLMADAGIYELEPMAKDEDGGGVVKGTATFRERMPLPPSAVFEATLEDVSKADAAADVIGSTRMERPGNPPIDFEITYDPSRIEAEHRYAVRARIMVEGKLFFTTDQSYPVLTGGNGNEVRMLLRRAGGSAPSESGVRSDKPAASLENTDWKLMSLSDTEVPALPREPQIVLDSETKRVAGSGGCNRVMGSYEVSGHQIRFNQMASTMMACPQGMDTEKAFLNALNRAKTWKITGEQLELFDADGHSVAKLESRYMK